MSPADLTRDFGFLGTWSPRTGSQEYPGGQNDSFVRSALAEIFHFSRLSVMSKADLTVSRDFVVYRASKDPLRGAPE